LHQNYPHPKILMEISAAIAFERKLRSVLAPDPHRDPVAWLEHHVKSIPYSPQSGPFRIKNSPWLAEPLRALVDPEVQEIAVLGSVQMGKSWVTEAASCLIPLLAPGPTLMLQDIDRNADDWLNTRLRVLWESIPAVKNLIGPEGIPKKGAINFKTNSAWVLGANNERNLQRRSIRYILGDEVWQWGNGSIKEALARTTAFKWQSKTVFVSQGGTEGHDWAEFWKTTDQRVWTFACPDCGHRQEYKWTSLKFPETALTTTGWDLNQVRAGVIYICEKCSSELKDTNAVRTRLNSTGAYVATNPRAPKERRGYNFNALCSQWGLSWGDLAVECIEASRAYDERGDTVARQEFKTKRLAQHWQEEADEIKIEETVGEYKLGDPWPDEAKFINGKPVTGIALPPDPLNQKELVRCRFLSVDVQKRGFYYTIRSWDAQGKSRLVACGYVFAWSELADVQKKHDVHPFNVFVDCGDQKDEVLAACGARGWNATRGDQRNEFAWKIRLPSGMTKTEYRPYSPAIIETSGQKRVKVFYYSNLRFKDTLSTLIRRGRHTRAQDVPQEYLAQMQSERRTITSGGKPIWEQIGDRPNHFFDTECIGLLPAMAYKLTGRVDQDSSEDGQDENKTATP